MVGRVFQTEEPTTTDSKSLEIITESTADNGCSVIEA